MVDNELNNNYSRNLSKMDEIFIPEDLDDVSKIDYAEYKQHNLNFWRTVPKNCRLVKKTWPSGDITAFEGYGLKIFPPFITKTIFVSDKIVPSKIEYKNEVQSDQNNINLTIDLTLIASITDPAKYKTSGTTQYGELKSMVTGLLKIYVAKKHFDELKSEQCELNKFDEEGKFIKFENEHGIKINEVIIERVQLPEELQKYYDEIEKAKLKQTEQSIRIQTEKEKAKAAAEIMEIQTQSEAKRLKTLEKAKLDIHIKKMNQSIETLQSKGFPTAEISEQLNLETASKGGNAIFMSGKNNNTDIAPEIYAGNIASQNRKEIRSRINPETGMLFTNSEFLIHNMDMIAKLKGSIPTEYQELKDALSTPGNPQKEYYDNLTAEQFEKVLEVLGF